MLRELCGRWSGKTVQDRGQVICCEIWCLLQGKKQWEVKKKSGSRGGQEGGVGLGYTKREWGEYDQKLH